MRLRILLALLLCSLSNTQAQKASPDSAKTASLKQAKFGPLFKHETVLNISLNTNIKAILKD